ncbi:MAG: NAD(P)H-dependent oxidoreductase [Candidatus Peribacteraceae bacterium]|nr:NAD(P)H-dependent oxidoreductase [Candidatus Peribacteraceae bacterium]
MKITIVVAGNNRPSNAAFLAETFAAGLKTAHSDIQITTLTLAELDIPHFTLAAYDPDHSPTPDTHKLHEAVKNADGIVVASPVWNFSVPAHLKNALDHLGAVCLDQATHSKGQLKDKPCMFLFTGGAPMIAWKVLLNITTLHVSEAFKYYGAAVVGRHFEPKCLPGRGKFGLVLDQRADLPERMAKKAAAFGRIVAAYQATGALPPLVALRRSAATWAYRIGNRVMYPISNAQ